MKKKSAILEIFPETAKINKINHLVTGDCDLIDLCSEYGTPLYIFDEDTIRSSCHSIKSAFDSLYQETLVIYACKAFINTYLAELIKQEGLGLDVVSAGELHYARRINFPMQKVYFHGNNKGADELRMAVDLGIGRIVVDNLYEIQLLSQIMAEKGKKQDILIRINPGVDPHTHQYISTGVTDSKFGFPISTGQAEEATGIVSKITSLNLVGFHFHLGSSLYEAEPYTAAINIVFDFYKSVRARVKFTLEEFSVGGGFAVQYELGKGAPPPVYYAKEITGCIKENCQKAGLKLPRLIVEPGRSIIARAGVALYTAGAIKNIPGIRKYVCVDGGMGDNIRPAIYGAKYEALVANKANFRNEEKVTIAGKFCESGDILIKDIELPLVESGDIIAIPTCGAYSIPMSSNYNAFLKPAIVMVRNGRARLVRRRETFDDLTRVDVD